MNLFDPSLALPSPTDSWVPIVSWSVAHREKIDAEIATPIADKYDAPQSRRYQIREFITGEMNRALRTLVSQFFTLHGANTVNVNRLTEPSEAEKRDALARLRKDHELHRLARKVAECRGYLAYLDQLDVRDKISSKPRVPEKGNTTPGIAGTTLGIGLPPGVAPYGLR